MAVERTKKQESSEEAGSKGRRVAHRGLHQFCRADTRLKVLKTHVFLDICVEMSTKHL